MCYFGSILERRQVMKCPECKKMMVEKQSQWCRSERKPKRMKCISCGVRYYIWEADEHHKRLAIEVGEYECQKLASGKRGDEFLEELTAITVS